MATTSLVIIIDVAALDLCNLCDLLLCGILFAMPAESRVRRLVLHEVLSLDKDEIAQEWHEEQGAHHGDNQREVKENLCHHCVVLNDQGEQASSSCRLQGFFLDYHVDIYRKVKGG